MKISKNQKQKINKTAKKYGLKLVLIFGSFASGKKHKYSDYDIAVLTAENRNISDLKNYNDILFFLSEVLEIPSQKVDLTNLNNANPLLSYEITIKGTLVFGDKDLFDEYRARSFRNYIDARPLFDLEHRLIEKRHQMLKQLILKQ
jgi:hypothetical protein